MGKKITLRNTDSKYLIDIIDFTAEDDILSRRPTMLTFFFPDKYEIESVRDFSRKYNARVIIIGVAIIEKGQVRYVQ